MKLKRGFLALGIATGLSAAAVLVACSSEDTVVNPVDGGGADTGKPDTGAVVDAGTDTGADSGQIDAGFKPETFPQQVADAMCATLARCCFGDATIKDDAGVDGGTFEKSKCLDFFKANGFEGSNLHYEVVDGGGLTVDQQKASDCVAGLNALSCNLGGTEMESVRAKCFDAVQGTAATGQPCHYAIECAKGNFCNPGDGGVGTCEALRATNGACGDFTDDTAAADEACSWRGSGGAHCNTFYPDAGFAAQGDWKCATSVAVGQFCASDLWCNASVCDPDTNNCVASATVFPMAYCATYVKP